MINSNGFPLGEGSTGEDLLYRVLKATYVDAMTDEELIAAWRAAKMMMLMVLERANEFQRERLLRGLPVELRSDFKKFQDNLKAKLQ